MSQPITLKTKRIYKEALPRAENDKHADLMKLVTRQMDSTPLPPNAGAAPIITLILGLVISLFVFNVVHDWEQSRLESVFQLNAQSRLAAFHTDIMRHQELVTSMANLFSANPHTSRAEFQTFTQPALKQHKEIHGLGWDPLIKDSQRRAFIEKNRLQGFPNFRITEVSSEGKRVSAATRDTYVVVEYIEPYTGNEAALGFDIASHPGRLIAINKARDSGKAIITERIRLVQEKQDKFGYLLLKAVYRGGITPDTLAQRRDRFLGVAVGVFRFVDSLPFNAKDLSPSGMDIWVNDLDAPDAKQLLHFHSSRTREIAIQPTAERKTQATAGLHVESTVEVMGRTWSFLFAPTPQFYAKHQYWQAYWTAGLSLLITLLLSLNSLRKSRYLAQLANTNGALAKEIDKRQETQKQLIDSEEKYRLSMQASQVGLWDWDVTSGEVYYSPGWEQILGLEDIDNVYQEWEKRIHPDDRESVLESLREHLDGKTDAWMMEHRLCKNDGNWIWVAGRGRVMTRAADRSPLRMLGTMTDIDKRKHIEDAHRQSKANFSLLLESTAEGIYGIDTEGRCTFVNQACVRLLGYDNKEQLLGQQLHDLVHYKKADGSAYPLQECRIYQAFKVDSESHAADEVFWRKDGSSFPVEYWSHPMHKDGEVVGAVVTFFDITEQTEAAQEKEQLLHDMEERIKEMRCMFQVTEAVRRNTTLDGILYEVVNVIPPGWHYPEYTVARISLDDQEYTTSHFTATEWKLSSDLIINNRFRGSIEVYYTKKFPELDEGPFVRQERSLIDTLAKTLCEAIEHRNALSELEHLATHDALTGLYNRKVLEQRIHNELMRAARYERPASMFLLDIDHFKDVNDTHGHPCGDRVLKQLADFLKASMRSTDYAARYGGEEFVVVLPETNAKEAAVLAERLRAKISEMKIPLSDEDSLRITASIGVSTYPDNASTWQDLLHKADLALYQAKNAGRNRVVSCTDKRLSTSDKLQSKMHN